MPATYEEWMKEVRAAFDSLVTPMEDWPAIGAFDFRSEYNAGVKPKDAAMKANRRWWHDWNKSLNQECQRSEQCWLPRGHEGQCQPIAGDHAVGAA
jgi:hypothetical protein